MNDGMKERALKEAVRFTDRISGRTFSNEDVAAAFADFAAAEVERALERAAQKAEANAAAIAPLKGPSNALRATAKAIRALQHREQEL